MQFHWDCPLFLSATFYYMGFFIYLFKKHRSLIYYSEEIIMRNIRDRGLHYGAVMAGDQHISFGELWSTLKKPLP